MGNHLWHPKVSVKSNMPGSCPFSVRLTCSNPTCKQMKACLSEHQKKNRYAAIYGPGAAELLKADGSIYAENEEIDLGQVPLMFVPFMQCPIRIWVSILKPNNCYEPGMMFIVDLNAKIDAILTAMNTEFYQVYETIKTKKKIHHAVDIISPSCITFSPAADIDYSKRDVVEFNTVFTFCGSVAAGSKMTLPHNTYIRDIPGIQTTKINKPILCKIAEKKNKFVKVVHKNALEPLTEEGHDEQHEVEINVGGDVNGAKVQDAQLPI